VTSPAVMQSNAFQSGEYACVSGQRGSLTVSGPFPADGERSKWLFTGMLSGVWTTGSAVGNPDLRTLPSDALLPVGWAFGTNTNGTLVAVQQLGNRLIIAQPRHTTGRLNRTEYSIEGASQWMFEKIP